MEGALHPFLGQLEPAAGLLRSGTRRQDAALSIPTRAVETSSLFCRLFSPLLSLVLTCARATHTHAPSLARGPLSDPLETWALQRPHPFWNAFYKWGIRPCEWREDRGPELPRVGAERVKDTFSSFGGGGPGVGL